MPNGPCPPSATTCAVSHKCLSMPQAAAEATTRRSSRGMKYSFWKDNFVAGQSQLEREAVWGKRLSVANKLAAAFQVDVPNAWLCGQHLNAGLAGQGRAVLSSPHHSKLRALLFKLYVENFPGKNLAPQAL